MEENKLFIICPFSNIESFLRKEFGEEIFFMTYSGGVIQYCDIEFLSHVKDIVLNEKISQIYFVNDINCKFIDEVLSKKTKKNEISVLLEEYYVQHYFSLFENKSIANQKYNLAKINIFNQIQEFVNSFYFKNIIESEGIEIYGMITDKINNLKKEIKNKVYEY